MFNWLKLKSISPQTLYRNRLFIERDSKTRRVMSNFGLTFRNSKWSDYTLNNVSLQSIERAKRVALYFITTSVLLFTLLTTEFGSYFNIELVGSYALKECVWLWYDYTTLTFVLMLTSYKSLLTNVSYRLYESFILKVLKVDADVRHTESAPLELKIFKFPATNKIASETILPNKLQRILVTTMMTSPATPNSIQRDVLVDLYRAGSPNPFYLTTLLFYKRLFVTTDYVLRSQLNSQLHNLTTKSDNLNTLQHLLVINDFRNYSPLLLNYFTHSNTLNNSNVQSTKGVGSLSLDAWSLATLDSELGKLTSSKVWTLGSFYYSSLETNKLNRLLTTPSTYTLWNDAITQQMNFFKWMRWLYRYSILHRNVINYSHKITNVKKLLSSGFFSSNLTQNNLWASNLMTTSTGRDTFVSAWSSLYGDTFTPSQLAPSLNILNSSSLSSNKLNNLNFYEQSYFFYLHRFDLFSSLPTLSISSNFTQRTPDSSIKSVTSPNQTLSLSSTDLSLRSYTLLNNSFTPYSVGNMLNKSAAALGRTQSTSSLTHELVLLESNKSFLSDSSCIDTLLNLTEVSKVGSALSPYFTHMVGSVPLNQSELWNWPATGATKAKQTPYTFTYSDALFTNDLTLRTRLLTRQSKN